MFSSSSKLLLALLCLSLHFGLGLSPLCASEQPRNTDTTINADIYQEVYQLISSFENRLPGSASYQSCLSGIEAICARHQIQTYRQSFNTLVPQTNSCQLLFDGKEISNCYPLAPNGEFILSSTEGKTLDGPCYYLGQGNLSDYPQLNLRNAIVVLELGSPHMLDVFSEGAQAVIFVENKKADRFNCSAHFTNGRQNIPRVYVSEETAQKFGLREANGQSVQLRIETEWQDATAENLIMYIPAKEPHVFNSGTAEQIVFSTTLDTFGLVPDLAQDHRKAANVALLVHNLIHNATLNHKRDILGVLWGSHYAGQEAARHFYFIRRNAVGVSGVEEDLDQHYQKIESSVSAQLVLLHHNDLLNQTNNPEFKNLHKRLREQINQHNNELNFEIQELNLANKQSASKDNQAKVELLVKERKQYIELYGHLTELKASNKQEIQELYLDKFVDIKQQVQSQLSNFLKQNRSLQRNHQQSKTLVPLLAGKNIITHLEYDYSESTQDIFPNAYGLHTLYFPNPKENINIGGFIRHMEFLGKALGNGNALLSHGHFNSRMYEQQSNPAFFSQLMPTPLNTEAAMSSKIFAYHLQHLGENRGGDEMPFGKTVDLRFLIPFNNFLMETLASDPGISVKFSFETTKPQDRYLHNCKIRQFAKGTNEIEGPAINAVCSLSSGQGIQPLVGYINASLCRVNGDGSFFEPMLTESASGHRTACKFNQFGAISHIGHSRTSFDITLFAAYGGGFFTPFVTDNYDLVLNIYHYNGKGNSKFITSYENHDRDERVFYTDRQGHFKISDTAGLLLLNETGHPKDQYYGTGLKLDPTAMRGLNAVQQSSRDYQLINTRRLNTLRDNNIGVNAVEDIHTLSMHHLHVAEEAREQLQIADARAHEVYGLSLSKRAYEPLKQVPKDLTSAIVILLILTIPFAFALERLFFGFPTIHKQILGFVGFFLLTFLILYTVHPAFSISATPSVIFLSFVIVIMSGMVINIIMGKFKYELMALQGLTSKSHSQAKNSSVGMASVLIGISSMRNRPLKTALTSITIILLTFTVLVFGSFGSQEEVVKTHLGNNPGHKHLEIFRNSLLHIPDRLRQAIQHQEQNAFAIHQRSALFHNPCIQHGPFDASIPVVANAELQALPLQAKAFLGLQNAELIQDMALKQALPQGIQAGHIYLSPSAAESLQAQPGDILSIYGKSFIFGGAFKVNELRALRYIDNKKVLPPDYLATINDLSGGRPGITLLNDQVNNLDAGSFRWCNTDNLIIGDFQDVVDLGGVVNVLTLYPKADVELDLHAQALAQIFHDPIYARGPDGDKQYFYTTSFSGSGFSDIWVPLLLGGLIIFSSLLGSIVDREREIFTFSALGLAPPNVAALFFAESSVYAVIGGLGGYLISQIVAECLTWLSSQGIYQAPEMNFSSLSSIYTILLVMLIVLLSTIYPAIKAGKSANPGINRKWKMPNPINGTLTFVFPFTISEHNLLGIVSFIAEHFENHADASLGLFAASDISIDAISSSDYRLRAHVALSPFDLGIAQYFSLTSKDSDIGGIKEIHIALKHDGGSAVAWVRNNRRFLNDLRHQFLLWRSLPVETIEYYCQKTRAATTEK